MKRVSYKSSILYSLLFHLLIINFLFLNIDLFDKTNYVTHSSVVNATLIEIPQPTVKEINKNKEIAPPKEVVKETPTPVTPKPKEISKTEVKKTIKIEEKKIIPEKQKAVEKKEEHLEKKVEKKETKLKKTEKNMEEKLWAQQLAAEDKQLTLMKEQQAKGVINKYNALILQAIRENWILPENYPPDLNCQLLIKLKSDGTVLDAELSKSSGNDAFDRSARVAVYKASPLPVPKESDLFKQMQEINLIVRP